MKKILLTITIFLLILEAALLVSATVATFYSLYLRLYQFAIPIGRLLFILIPLTIYAGVLTKSGSHLKGATFGLLSLYLLSFFGLEISYFASSSGVSGVPDLLADQFGLLFSGSDDLIFFFTLVSSWILTFLLGWVLTSTKTFLNILKVSVPASIIFGFIAFGERYLRLQDNLNYITYFWKGGEIFEPIQTIIIPSLILTIIGYFILRKFSKPQDTQSNF